MNIYIITVVELGKEFVHEEICFGTVPVHHKVTFSFSPVESIGDFMDKVGRMFAWYLLSHAQFYKLAESTTEANSI